MKIAVVIDTWFPFIGGGQVNTWEISKRIAQKGHQVDIVTRNNGDYKQEKVKNLGVIRLGPKSDPDNNLSRIIFLIKSFFYIKGKDYELVHLQAFLPGLLSPVVKHLLKKRTVFTVHGTSINTKLNNPASKLIEKILLTRMKYDAQITVSRDFLGIKNVNKRVTYIPNGVDVKKFDKVRVSKFKEPTIIFVGRLHPQKNLKNLIEAISYLKEQMPRIRLLIVGEGKLKKELQEQAKRLNLDKNVKFLGGKTGEDLARLYKSSHVFILPSIYEGQPLTLLEAWAAKLPAIVSRTGDCQYLIKNGINGYIMKSNNSQEIKKSVQNAFKNEKGLSVLGSTAYRQDKSFSRDEGARKTMELHKSLTHI